MATITEDYVSFEVAKLLKEKGFDESCRYYYVNNGNLMFTEEYLHNSEIKYGTYTGCICTAPTLQMAMKWLREVHNITIVVTPSMFWGRYNVYIYKRGNDFPIGFDGSSLISSYEQACELAIKYCLENLIK